MAEWKDIPGFENIYQASTDGRIRTCAGKTTMSVRHGVRRWEQRELKQRFLKRKSGTHVDARVTLWKDKTPHYYLVARLIAMTWCDGFAEGMTVNHIDGNPANNSAANLEWVTLGENIRKGFESGLYPTKPCVLVDSAGHEMLFKSLAEAGRYIGKGSRYLSDAIRIGRLRTDGNRVYLKG